MFSLLRDRKFKLALIWPLSYYKIKFVACTEEHYFWNLWVKISVCKIKSSFIQRHLISTLFTTSLHTASNLFITSLQYPKQLMAQTWARKQPWAVVITQSRGLAKTRGPCRVSRLISMWGRRYYMPRPLLSGATPPASLWWRWVLNELDSLYMSCYVVFHSLSALHSDRVSSVVVLFDHISCTLQSCMSLSPELFKYLALSIYIPHLLSYCTETFVK